MKVKHARASDSRGSAFPEGFSPDDVERIGVFAARSIGMDRELARRIGPRLASARAARRTALAEGRRPDPEVPERPGTLVRRVWGVLCVLLAVAVTSTAAMLGPIRRSEIGDPETSWPIALVAVVTGLISALVLLLVRPPRRGDPLHMAEVVFWVCGGLLALVLLYRATGGFGRRVEYAPEQELIWTLLAVPLLVLTALLALRWRLLRARLTPAERTRGSRRPENLSAESLIAGVLGLAGPLPAAVQEDWAARIDREGRPSPHVRRASARALEAARSIGPVEVLARLYVDDAIDVEPFRRALG